MEARLNRIWRDEITGNLSDNRNDANHIPLDIVYDNDTRVVYYNFTKKVSTDSYSEHNLKIGFMSPYIGPNGKMCKFINCQIKEIS